MLTELKGGFAHHAYLVTPGVVFKEVPEEARKREVYAYTHIPFAPDLYEETSTGVFMSFMEGENRLHDQLSITSTVEVLTAHIMHEAGKQLAIIHNHHRLSLPTTYHTDHKKRIERIINSSQDFLNRHDVNEQVLRTSLFETYDSEEIERHGLTFNHNDYWLNNFYGMVHGQQFKFTGIIDWERSGMASPYDDLSVVKLSIDRYFPDYMSNFWHGYGEKPSPRAYQHFAVLKALDFLTEGVEPPPAFSSTLVSYLQETIA